MTTSKKYNKQNEANAFQIMMDARSKSIGTNSPGEEKAQNSELNVLRDQNKELLAKRKIKFESWAAEKGGLKRKQREEIIDAQIKDELDKRAKRLRKLISNQNKKSLSEEHIKVKHEKKVKSKKNALNVTLKSNICQSLISDEICENLSETKVKNNVLTPKPLNDQTDYEFLSKLNPSLKKNQNLLSYFEKVSPEVVKPVTKLLSTPESAKKGLVRSPKWKVRILSFEDVSHDNENGNEIIEILEKDDKKIEEKVVAPVFTKILQNKLTKSSNNLDKTKKSKDVTVDTVKHFYFPVFSHIYQKSESNVWNLSKHPDLGMFSIQDYKQIPFDYSLTNNLFLGFFTDCNRSQFKQNKMLQASIISKQSVILNKNHLLKLKRENPDFPVYRTYKSLKSKISTKTNDTKELSQPKRRSLKLKKEKSTKKNTEVNNLSWCDIFCPNSSQEFICNRDSLDLKKWLGQWKEYNELKTRRNYDSDASYNSDSDFLHSDVNFKSLKNSAVLLGPSGSGKTLTVYSIAHELGYNVIELNASSKRTGKIAFSKLQEATQSHGVRDKDINLQFFETVQSSNKTNNLEKKLLLSSIKSNTEKNMSKNLSLILIEDIDIVFDEDDGLISAISQIMQTSKRPVVFTCTDENNAYVRKFINDNLLFKFRPANISVMSIWLQILCFVNNYFVDKQVLYQMLDSHKGDIRKSLHQLQYWILSGGDCTINNALSEQNKNKRDSLSKQKSLSESMELFSDESSNLSISSDHDGQNDVYHKRYLLCMCTDKLRQNICHMYTLENIWLHISINKLLFETNKEQTIKEIPIENYLNITKFLENTLYIDVLTNCQSKNEDMNLVTDNLKKYLLRNLYMKTETDPHEYDILMDHYKSVKCNISKTNAALEQAVCDRNFVLKKSFTLDYGPALRSICRAEKQRSETNGKRATSNRFYHYFRTLDIDLKNDVQTSLCNYFC